MTVRLLVFFLVVTEFAWSQDSATQPPSTAKSLNEATAQEVNYSELGLPDANSVWSVAEYEKASIVLTSLAKNDFRSLPRKGNKNSGRIFARLIATENIDTILNLFFTGRADLRKFLNEVTAISMAYVDLKSGAGYFHEELAELSVFQIRIIDRLVSRALEFNLDLSRPGAKQEFDRMLNSIASIIMLTLDQQITNGKFLEDDLLLYSDAIGGCLATKSILLDAQSLQKITVKINTLISSTNSRKVKSAYQKILKAI